MNDTQWGRYQVFVQEKEGAPHIDAGSVHASDPELALLNARDVFVRRPECVNLWVVPVQGIMSKTAEELKELETQEAPGLGPMETYLVFCKTKSAGTQTLVGSVEASSPPQAMQRAVARHTGKRSPFAWWVFPSRLVLQTTPQDIESMLAPALDKPFRLSTDFHTVSAMREIKKDRGTQETPVGLTGVDSEDVCGI